jgi:hypothetical protein
MTKRQINVDKLTDEQLANAEKKMYEKISYEVDQLLNKWRPEFKNFGQHLDVQVEIDREQVTMTYTKDLEDLSKFYDDSKLGVIAKELDRVSYGMNKDLENAVTNCNQLLNRYGIFCGMAFTSKNVSN